MKQKLYHDKWQVDRGFTVNKPVRVRITDRGFMSVCEVESRCCFGGVWRSVVSHPDGHFDKACSCGSSHQGT